MKKSFLPLLLSALVLTVVVVLHGVESPLVAATQSKPSFPTETSPATTTATQRLVPGDNDGSIAYVTARLLERNHYLHRRLDDDLSSMFFDRYLETLDPQHMHFTEEDIAKLDRYRERLDDLTLPRTRIADTSPAYEIFNCFLERLAQRVAYVDELLKTEKFDFSTDERILANRRESPYPENLAAAKRLWRQRLRYEYLQEKLGRHVAKPKGGEPAMPKDHSAASPANGATNLQSSAAETPKNSDAEEIVELLSKRYHRNLRVFSEWDSEDVLAVYLTALAHVYDPHSDYMNKIGADNFAIGMNLQLFGIGAVLTSDLDGYCKIQELKPGPAMKSKQIKVGDRIVAVAQSNAPPVDVVEMNLNKAVQLIRGPKGTEVRLTIIPADSPSERRVVTLIRDEIKLEDQEVKGKIIELPASAKTVERLGVIDLPSFYATIEMGDSKSPELTGDAQGTARPTPRSTSADVARLLKKFKEENVAGVILDLRRNGGGSLEEAVKLTGLFIKEGPVVQVRYSDGNQIVREDTDPAVLYDGPLIVLTSRFSASASEIVAGALQDYGRAVVVGDISTHGKGTVQNLNPLRFWLKPATETATNDPGELKITIQKFYRPSGFSTQLKGVMPDIVLPSIFNYSKDIGESALENPLEPGNPISRAPYEKLKRVEPYLAELLKRSGERVEADKDFAYIREDIEQFRKNQADKTISLNEQQRLKERDEADARQKARDKERLARKAPDRKIYELSLKQAALPGLPPPVEKTNAAPTNLAGKTGGSETSTNSPSVASSPPGPSDNLDEDEPADTAPAVDATLEEAENILVDYISLLSQKSLLTTTR